MTAGRRDGTHDTNAQAAAGRRAGRNINDCNRRDAFLCSCVATLTTRPMSEMTRKSSNSHLITCTDTRDRQSLSFS